MPTNNTIQKNRVYAPIIVGLSLLLVAFAVYPLYSSFVDMSAQAYKLNQEKWEKQSKVDEIKNMQALFASGSSDALTQKVKRYDRAFNSSDIMEVIMINDYTKDSALNPATIRIGGVNLNKGTKLPSGLSLGTANINITANSVDDIVNYLTYLTVQSPLAFTIDNISLPLDTTPSVATTANSQGISIGVTLGIYYYE